MSEQIVSDIEAHTMIAASHPGPEDVYLKVESKEIELSYLYSVIVP